MKFDRTAPGGGVEVVCRLENARAYLEWNIYFMQEGESSMSGQTRAPGRTDDITKAKKYDSVKIYLADQRGNVVMECLKALQEEEPMVGVLLQPHLWQGIKEPYLYNVEAVLTDRNGRCVDRLRRQLPLCDLRNRNVGSQVELVLNGEPITPKAVCYILPDADGEVQQQRLMLEDLQQMIRLGANCVCMKKKEPSGLFLQFCRLCDRYGMLVFLQGREDGKEGWGWSVDRKIGIQRKEKMPDYRGVEHSLFQPESPYPSSLYYKYKAKWSDEPFIYLVPESLMKLKSGNYSVCCYSNCSKIALYTDGILFEVQEGEGEFFFREIPARQPCIMLTAKGDGCSTSLSMHKLLVYTHERSNLPPIRDSCRS